MTITDQIKILNKKIMQNEAQYDLDRKSAKISTLPSNNLNKYEYLTSEDLGLKPSIVEQAKFKYSPLGEIFNKGLSEDNRKERSFKRLENIKDKNEEQLQAIKDQEKKQLKKFKNFDKSKMLKAIGEISKKNEEANKLLSEFQKIDRILDKTELVCTKLMEPNMTLSVCASNNRFTLEEAIEKQKELRKLINKVNDYGPRISKKAKEKNRVLKSSRKLSDARDNIIDSFEKGTFPYKGSAFKTKKEESEESKLEK